MKSLQETLDTPGWPSNFDNGNYFAESDERLNWLLVYTRTRDADALEESNFRSFLKLLGGESKTVAIIRFSHWACGWLDHIVVNPHDVVRTKLAADTLKRLEGYPIVNENDFSNLETEQADTYWKTLTIKERIDLCKEYGISILQARYDYVPSNDGRLDEYLRG